jgi:hypothetical protein
MRKYIIKIYSEVILVSLKKDLIENDFIFQERVISDSSFPSLNDLNGISEVTISIKEDSGLISILSKQEYKGKIELRVLDIKPSKKVDKLKVGLIIYAILITILFLRFWYLDYLNSSDKNFEYKWNTNLTRQDVTNKKTQKIESSYFDENYDFNYELQYSYFNGKGPVMVRRDKDENGYAEVVEFYNLEGNLYAYYQDLNNDAWFDYSYLIIEGGDTLLLVDSDMNGFYEIKKK